MKRIKELHKLSADHHLGLVIARRARLAVKGEEGYNVPEMWEEVERKFPEELEPHFRIEEEYLAPHMDAAGEHEMMKRFREDHTALRRAVESGAGRSGENLKDFADLLESHIRFEERELFEKAQDILDAEIFKAIENACSEANGR